ncbi:glycosyltransferase family 2 protein [Marinobacter sp. M3C]|jgi:glycosyltransferase involved in cell wall biosynthesis|uniref:glycosyltransferase family 2 protein n=1 Tax=unclassified Marinobacter TaxID=83889 RepID=UPI00200F82A8|nr:MULTISPECIES: glycosyltransferase family 2 protein [unclassified Marinobacter]MCL1479089.1 glycosyltransferase family 2 protein [Marinobacter sp.]MCL1485111.1 glycosyltransferase family 2 protein [Marinobacter sp.]MCL1488943.1 glycosyltransferase family 2 protein [Marinobacter sp.]UQG57166.1 glycosyltransferase family 2 protein [Marinobacter sp. M4C]UQG61651.1 glycosyltransferase family 2 protein [Marinobacter sp. M3C]
MKISIAMATYNGAQYIQEQLESFLDQTRQPDELIITDDCSTDETETIVREFAKTAPFTVKFYRNERNLGYCGNFNAALMKTTGDLVFLSDQDDLWFPEKIEHMVCLAEQNPGALVLMNDAVLTDKNLESVGLTKLGQIRSAGFSDNAFVMGCCCAVRRELLNICMPILPGFKAHDNWIVGFSDQLNKKFICDEPLQYYRRHDSNESQFIANRTTKVTRWHAFFHAKRNLLSRTDDKVELFELEQRKLLSQGIRHALMNAPLEFHPGLSEMLRENDQPFDIIETRINFRQKRFCQRVFAIVGFAAGGGYRSANGVRSILRDFLGGRSKL